MPAQCIPIWPERFLHWRDQRALVQGEQVAGEVVVGGERFGRNHLIALRDAQQPLVKAPVTEFAERQPVARIVIVANRPGDDVRGVDCGVAVDGAQAP